MSHEYRQLYSIHKNKRYLRRYWKDVETRFDISTFELDRPLHKRKYKKLIRLMKDELGEKIMTNFIALRPKTYSYLTDDHNENKKEKAQKSVL